LRSITSLQRTVSTPPLVDFSRASPLDLFEQPAKRLFSSVAAEQQASPVAANGSCTLRKSADLIQSRNHREKSKPLPSTSHVDVTCTPISALYEAYSSACTDPIPLELGTQMFVLQWTLPATTQLFAIWAATKAQPVVEKMGYRGFPWDPTSRKYPMARNKYIAVCGPECLRLSAEKYDQEHARIMKLPGAR
jgi:hypothetical protein